MPLQLNRLYTNFWPVFDTSELLLALAGGEKQLKSKSLGLFSSQMSSPVDSSCMSFGATVPIAVKDWPGWREDCFELSWW